MKTSVSCGFFLPKQTWTCPIIIMSFLNWKENQFQLLLFHSYSEFNLLFLEQFKPKQLSAELIWKIGRFNSLLLQAT